MPAENQPTEESRSQNFSFKEANLMQADLIKKSGIDPLRWADKNAAAFREIVESNPELAELYRQNPEAAEEFVERQLKKKTFH